MSGMKAGENMSKEEELSEHGSELDFKEEDYVPSEGEEDSEKAKKKKPSGGRGTRTRKKAAAKM